MHNVHVLCRVPNLPLTYVFISHAFCHSSKQYLIDRGHGVHVIPSTVIVKTGMVRNEVCCCMESINNKYQKKGDCESWNVILHLMKPHECWFSYRFHYLDEFTDNKMQGVNGMYCEKKTTFLDEQLLIFILIMIFISEYTEFPHWWWHNSTFWSWGTRTWLLACSREHKYQS